MHEHLPLRFNQEQILLFWELAERHERPVPPFTFVVTVRFGGTVAHQALQDALNTVVRRHAGLRTVIQPGPSASGKLRDLLLTTFGRLGLFIPGMYVQAVIPTADLVLREDRLESLSDGDISRLVERDALDPFDCATPPLIRARLVNDGQSDHALVLVVSHLVADVRSVYLMRSELLEVYRSRLEGRPCHLPEVAVDCPSFALWEHQQLQQGAFDESLSYWRTLWSSFENDQLRYSDLMAGRSEQTESVATGTERVLIDLHLSQRLKALARRERVTLYVLFRACFMISLHRLTGRTRLALGGNLSNRSFAGVDRTVGWLNNRHLIASDVSSDPSGRQVLAETRDAAIQALRHQALPVTALWNRIGRRLDVGPDLVLATFDYYSESPQLQAADGQVAHPMKLLMGPWVRRDLDVRVVDTRDGFVVSASYATRRYARRTIRPLLDGVRECALALVRNPDERVSRYAVLRQTSPEQT